MMLSETVSKIFAITSSDDFHECTQDVFELQYQHNTIYRQWCDLLHADTQSSINAVQPPFIPISFFKTHSVKTTTFSPALVFESSGTTTSVNSKHFVKDVTLYKQSFLKAFQLFYGDVKDWCIIGLLPSYLERNNSSLVYMVNELIKESSFDESGFYLDDFERLRNTLLKLEQQKKKVLLIGVTFGLLDFAERFSVNLQSTTIMETGGMKGRREELTRSEVHAILKNNFGLSEIHSEYGMTELLSQAYSKGNGRFICPPWMKVMVRDEDDPLKVKPFGRGALNIIDLANVYSCSFIATDDLGIVYEDGSFEVLGRLDNCDIRGCSLLAI